MARDCLKRGIVSGLAAGIILLAGTVETAQSAGLAVSPAGLMVQGVRPGEVHDIYEVSKTGLTIYNKDDVPHTYLLSAHQPSTAGNRRWEKGYLEIPDPTWCRFDKEEITVEANATGFVSVYLGIPNEEKYYNQHWVVTLGIMGKPEGGVGVSLGIYVRMQIETEAKEETEARPEGTIGIKPALIYFEEVSPGKLFQKGVTIYNNTLETCTYTISSLFQKEGTDKKTYLTYPYQPIPDSVSVAADKKGFTVLPMGSYHLKIDLKIPPDLRSYGKRWEEILLVEPDKGLPGFIRVQIDNPLAPTSKAVPEVKGK